MTTAFTARRAIHQQCTSAEFTGDIPVALWLSSNDEELGYHAQRAGWCGCLDAPEQMPAGSVIPVNISENIGGMGYEGNVASQIQR